MLAANRFARLPDPRKAVTALSGMFWEMSREEGEASDGEAQAQVILPSPHVGFGLDMQCLEFVWDLGGTTPAFPPGPLAKDLCI